MISCEFLPQLQEKCKICWLDVPLYSTLRTLVPYGLDISGSLLTPFAMCVCECMCTCVCECMHVYVNNVHTSRSAYLHK